MRGADRVQPRATTRAIACSIVLLGVLLAAEPSLLFSYDARFAFDNWRVPQFGHEAPNVGDATRGATSLADDAIRVTDEGLEHVLLRHVWSGSKTLQRTAFFDGEDIASLIGQASRVPPIRQANGNLAYVVNAGRGVGVSRLTGLPTEFYTVITRGDELLTAFPGFPR